MNSTVLFSAEREKDIWVIVSSDMKVSEQCGIAARKGNQILGLIRRNIAYRDKRLTSAVLRLECSLDCVSGSVSDQHHSYRLLYHPQRFL